MENKKKLLAYGEKLPWELIEEILSRVPPASLVRFKLVAKQWNTLFKDKTFINNHKATFRFILRTNSYKVYSVSIDPKIEVRELTLFTHGLKPQMPKYMVGRNELMLCRLNQGAAIWNPWLKQIRWIEDEVNHNQHNFEFKGIGYNNGSYKVLGSTGRSLWKIYDVDNDSNAWKDYDSGSGSSHGNGSRSGQILMNGSVSLNGNLYWASYYDNKSDGLSIMQFDFSSDKFKLFCDLPCVMNHSRDASVLAVFKEDRFSLLKQCHATKNIEVWVTKNKIDSNNGNDVEWMKFMEVSSPNLPDFVHPESNFQPSYCIEDKTLVVCFCQYGDAWIYVVGEDKVIRKIQIDRVNYWVSQYSYTPTFVPVPSVQREETGSLI